MKPVIIIQARTGSSRLPNKTLLPFYEGKGILEILVDRMRNALNDAIIVIATSTNSGDDAIETLCIKRGYNLYRGDENDVLSRFIGAADKYGADKIIRICADNIFLDMRSLAKLVDTYDTEDSDYLSYSSEEGKPMILTHYGLWAMEGCKTSSLKKVAATTNDKLYHEHVTNYLYTHPAEFNIKFIPIVSDIQNEQRLRLTIDTEDDFKMMQKIYSTLMDRRLDPSPENIKSIIDEMPEMYGKMEQIISKNVK